MFAKKPPQPEEDNMPTGPTTPHVSHPPKDEIVLPEEHSSNFPATKQPAPKTDLCECPWCGQELKVVIPYRGKTRIEVTDKDSEEAHKSPIKETIHPDTAAQSSFPLGGGDGIITPDNFRGIMDKLEKLRQMAAGVNTAPYASQPPRRDCIPDPNPPKSGCDPAYLALLDELRELHRTKASDYGRNNLKAATAFGVPNWVGVCIRMNDKVERVKKFARDGHLHHEGIEDTLKDLAAYALLALVEYREEVASGQAVAAG